MSRRLRAGIIGTGFMGGAHLEALRRVPGVEVAAITSHHPERARALAGEYAIPTAYESWEELLEDDRIDVVHNCTPNHLHYRINRAALEAGRHVVSEKPLTTTAKDAAELVRLAEERSLVTAVNFNYRFYPLIQQAHGMVRRGDLGDVHLVHGHYVQDWLLYETDYNWRLEPGVGGASRAVADIGSHWCDLVQFVTGLKVRRVFADLFRVHDTRKKPRETAQTFRGQQGEGHEEVAVETEDGAALILEFEGGARGVATISQVSAGRKNHLWFEADGAEKALSWNQERPNELWIGHRGRPNEVLIKDPSLLDEDAQSYAHYPGGHPEGYPDGPKNLFRNVYRHIREGRTDEPYFPTFADGAWEVRIVEAVLQSARERRWVNVA